MEKDYALEQQDKEALRLFIKRNNAITEGRSLAQNRVVMNDMFMKDEVGQFERLERAQIEQMKDLRKALMSNTGIKPDCEAINYKSRRMGLGIMQQMKQAGSLHVFKTTSGKFVAGIDAASMQEESSEPETLEQLIPQLNFNLVEDIISIEKR